MIRYVIIIIIFIFLNCTDNYPPIKPCFITSGEIEFNGINGTKKHVKFLYSVPKEYTPQKSWPLVIALHGHGANAAAFHDLWKAVTDSSGFVLLTPQGDEKIGEAFAWKWGNNAERAILICMDLVRKKVHINPRQVYLTGFSAGGNLTYFMGLKYSTIFQGIAPLSAFFDEQYLQYTKIRNSKLRAYISHGTLETEIAESSEIAVSKLQDLGFVVKYVTYKGIGHGLPEPKEAALTEILKFLNSKD